MSEAFVPDGTRVPRRAAAGTVARRASYPLRLARARLARRAGRLLLVGLGIAAGAAVLCVVFAGSLVIRDRSLERATAAIPASDRAVQATWFGTLSTGSSAWPALDRVVRPRLRAVTGREPVAAMLYREAQIDGHLVDLRAVDGIGRFVHLVSGRLPRPCVPTHCEVLRIDGAGPLPSTPSLRLVEVGRATLPASATVRDFLGRPPADTSVLSLAIRYHTPPRAPLVLADGVRGLARTPELATFYRSYAWFVPIEPGDVHPWSVGGLQVRVDRLRSELGADSVTGTAFDLTAPTDELAAAADRGRTAGRRLLLLGGEAATLLLAFMLLAAASLRRDAEAARRRLSWFGARRWQLALSSLAESGTVAAAATLAGWAAGIGFAALAASAADVPVGSALRHSAASAAGIGAAAGLAVAAALLLFAALRAPSARIGGASFSAIDAAAVGAALAVAIGLARGGTDVSQEGTGVFLLLLPGLVAFVAAVACARLLAPLLRAAERVGRGGPLPARLAALSLARNPGHATVAVTFLVVSVGLALFAAVYRSTLADGQRDQASYAVPADFVLSEDLSQLVPVSAVPRPAGAMPVVRQSGDVARLASSQGADVLGLTPAAFASLDGWRSDFSSRPLDRLAAAIRPDRPVSLETVPLDGARTIELPLRARGYPIEIRANVRLGSGDFADVRLGETPFAGTTVLRARLPRGADGLVGLTFAAVNGGRRSANAGTGIQPTPRGRVELGFFRADGKPVARPWGDWTGVGGITPLGGGAIRYFLTPDVDSGFRLRQATDGRPVPAIVSPALAHAAGDGDTLPLDVAGERVVVRVAGVAKRFPGTQQADFVVADEGTLSTALDTALPGLGRPDELWLNAPASTSTRLARPPYDVLSVQSRAQVEERLRDDPLARGALLVLGGTALVALGLALVGLLLVLLADMRDESGELFDLETQGAPPQLLRRHLRVRTLAVAVAGIVGGLATGAVLSVLVLDLVRLTANVAEPQPPLVLALDRRLALLVALAYAVVGAAVVLAASRPRALGRFGELGS